MKLHWKLILTGIFLLLSLILIWYLKSCEIDNPTPTLIIIPVFPSPATIEPVYLTPIPSEVIEDIQDRIDANNIEQMTAEERQVWLEQELERRGLKE